MVGEIKVNYNLECEKILNNLDLNNIKKLYYIWGDNKMKYKSSNKRIKSKKGINSITSLLNLFDSSKDRTNQYISNESIQ